MVSSLPPVLPYNSAMRMRDLIADNSLLLKVISRFGIALGFGNKTVAQVCDAKGIDTPTLLCVANFISGRPADIDTVSLTELMGYLQRAHSYFLDFMLPDIRRRLISVIGCSSPDEVGFLVRDITADGMLKLAKAGGIDPRHIGQKSGGGCV